METLVRVIAVNLAISAAVFFAIAVSLTLFGTKKKPDAPESGLSFEDLYIDYTDIPDLTTFTARDGKPLTYRYYPSRADKTLVLIHGSGWHSRYFFPLAEYLSKENLARVYTPDLRGHGPAPETRGDVESFDRLTDDLADLISLILKDDPSAKVIVGGHSSGGGLTVRFAGSRHGGMADAYLLLSPFLKYNAPTMRADSGGWAHPHVPRIIGLSMLNSVGIRWFNHLTVIEFNMPLEARDGTETLAYSHRMNTAYAPRNYKKDLSAIHQPLLVVVGAKDEAFIPEQFQPVISADFHAKGDFELLEGVTHNGLVVGPEIRPVLKAWLERL